MYVNRDGRYNIESLFKIFKTINKQTKNNSKLKFLALYRLKNK